MKKRTLIISHADRSALKRSSTRRGWTPASGRTTWRPWKAS